MRARNDGVIGNSVKLTAALDHLSQLAGIDRPVLVLGERGTGKELAAGRLHFLSPRWDAPFLKVNCAAMAESLLESELFGHESGAFTGATRLHVGRFERADGGTLLLDEIATMSARLQEKLLRVIEYGEFERLGGQKTLSVDVRIIGATHADLQALTAAGAFAPTSSTASASMSYTCRRCVTAAMMCCCWRSILPCSFAENSAGRCSPGSRLRLRLRCADTHGRATSVS
jgi:psp operon transcriptional activator